MVRGPAVVAPRGLRHVGKRRSGSRCPTFLPGAVLGYEDRHVRPPPDRQPRRGRGADHPGLPRARRDRDRRPLDRGALHVRLADERICIGPPRAEQSYQSIPAVVSAALATRADAVHPGYGFLAENGDLAEALRHSGVAFVGPRARHLRLMGDKARARRFMARAGVPVLPGTERPLDDAAEVAEVAAAIGYPVMVKAVAGGGGRGLRLVRRPGELAAAVAAARREAAATAGDARVFLERYLEDARHVEVQVLGDRHGRLVTLGGD